MLVETDNLPAMKASAQPPAPVRQRHLRRLDRSSTTADGLIAVPGLRDADVLRRHHGRDPGAAGRQADAAEFRTASRPKSTSAASRLRDSSPRPRRRSRARRAAPGDPPGSRGGRLPLPAAGASRSSRCSCWRRCVHSVWLSLFAWDGADAGDVGRARQLQGDRLRRRAARGVRARADPDRLLRGRADRDRAAARRRRCRARACAGWRCFRTVLFLPQVIALVVVAVMWRMIYAARRRPLNRGAARRSGSGSLTQGWLGDFTLRAAGGRARSARG